ncbi:MAG: SPOR domain-containing protein [Neisseriaceae bacterium]|nr:MAG: SPOR domain-containing protein [Neisseriaceae bacterium]
MKPRTRPISPQKEIVNRQRRDNEKSRRRLLGSVVVLLITLIILLKVTSNIKPLHISPEVVEIQANNEAESTINNTKIDASTTIAQSNESTEPQPEINDNPEAILNDTSAPTSGFKAGVVQRHTSQTTTQQAVTQPTTNEQNNVKVIAASSLNDTTTQPVTKPKAVKPVVEAPIIVTPTKKQKAQNNPENILNDTDGSDDLLSTAINNKKSNNQANNVKTVTTNTSGGKSYIQLAALSSQEKADSLKQELAAKGINATVQTIQTPKGTLYRLKAGPYATDVAKTKLQQLNGNGYSGILTNN